MNLRHLIAATAVTLLLAACSATKARISANEDLFNSYPPEVQAAIKSNRIERGFDSTQVYLALGNAHSTEMDGEQELWFYHQTHNQSVKEEKSASEYRDEMIVYESAVAAGGEGLSEPSAYRVVRLYRTSVCRIVRFEDGRVVSWEEPDGMWLDDWHQ